MATEQSRMTAKEKGVQEKGGWPSSESEKHGGVLPGTRSKPYLPASFCSRSSSGH